MISGPELFFRYAQPPNVLGYCGPDQHDSIATASSGVIVPVEESVEMAAAFLGAWPYLELIGALTGRDPLSDRVVEAYWVGNRLLDDIDLNYWGHSVSDRFRAQAGPRWPAVEAALNRGGSPNHAFHVFCVYPWVGLLREGFASPAVDVLNRCRISRGEVVANQDGLVLVRRRPLAWVDHALVEGEPADEVFRSVVPGLTVGDRVSLHWDYVCQRLEPGQERMLASSHDRHLAIANDELRVSRLEPAH